MQIIVCKDCEKTISYKEYKKTVTLYAICPSCKKNHHNK